MSKPTTAPDIFHFEGSHTISAGESHTSGYIDDLLCVESRLVIEVDGPQHLSDPAAYRRDRRKDQLLQENDYLVLRFLAEDVAKELGTVLDGILRSLSNRRTTADERSLRFSRQ